MIHFAALPCTKLGLSGFYQYSRTALPAVAAGLLATREAEASKMGNGSKASQSGYDMEVCLSLCVWCCRALLRPAA